MNTASSTTDCPLRHGDLRPGPHRAVFLDRDGVLIEDTGYPDDPTAIALLPDVPEALRELRRGGWALVVVTNQSGIARGRFGLARLAEIHDRLLEFLRAEAVEPEAVYFCPHHPEAELAEFQRDCDHRKPAAGMLHSAARDLGLRLEECWLVGDKESDVAAAHAAGCRAVKIGPGLTAADQIAPDLLTAARHILAGVESSGS